VSTRHTRIALVEEAAAARDVAAEAAADAAAEAAADAAVEAADAAADAAAFRREARPSMEVERG